MNSTGLVIVAAGQGRRLGLGPKALVNLNGETLLERVVEQARSAEFARIVAVLPPGVGCPVDGLQTAVNTEPESASLGSVVTGLRALEARGVISDLVVWPVDHPWVQAEQLLELERAAGQAHAGIARVVPVWQGRRGHPIWIRPAGVKRIRSVDSALASTLREVLAQAGDVLEIGARDAAVLRNLNHPGDLS